MQKPVKALFVGLNTVDLQFFIEGFPESNTKTKAHHNEIAAGGPALNASITCSFLGAETTLVTPIGEHSLTRFVTDDILQYDVKLIDPINKIESKPVFASIITDEINGERTIFSYHPERSDEVLLEELQLINLEEYDIALFDGFFPELSLSVAKQCRLLGVTTVLDGGSWKPGLKSLLPYIDMAICSNDFTIPKAKTKSDIVEKLYSYGVKKIAITRGEKTILCFENQKESQLEVSKVDTIDTLGAGDIFHGAFCYYFGIQPNFEYALNEASAIATFSCKYHGTRRWMKNCLKHLSK